LFFVVSFYVFAQTRLERMMDSDIAKHKVFVYGTLMSGQPAVGLLQGGKFLSGAWLYGVMYDFGRFPAIRLGGSSKIKGEVWLVSDKCLARLDRYEGEGRLYRRVADVCHDVEGVEIDCLVYEIIDAPATASIVDSGDWARHIRQWNEC